MRKSVKYIAILICITLFPTGCSTQTDKATPPEPPYAMAEDCPVVSTDLEMYATDIVAKMWLQNEREYILNNNSRVVEAAFGDLNGDGIADLAVAVEREPKDDFAYHTCYILMGDEDGAYTIRHSNDSLVNGYTEVYSSLCITEGQLTVSSTWAPSLWGESYTFAYRDGRLQLVKIYECLAAFSAPNGIHTTIDLENGRIETRSYCGNDRRLNDLLLYSAGFDHEAIYFEDPVLDIIKTSAYPVGTPFAPSLGSFEYQGYDGSGRSESLLDLPCHANDALMAVFGELYSDSGLVRKQIPWTDETKMNYTTLLFYEMPDFFFENDEGRLYHSSIWVSAPEGSLLTASHIIKWQSSNDDNRFVLYWVDGVTGEVS